MWSGDWALTCRVGSVKPGVWGEECGVWRFNPASDSFQSHVRFFSDWEVLCAVLRADYVLQGIGKCFAQTL